MAPEELKAMIESDRIASEHYAAGRDIQCAERCSVIAPQIRVPVSAADIQYHAALNGVWAKITIAREHSETPDLVRGICITFLDWTKSGRPIDFDFIEVKTMLGGLIQSGLVTQEQADELDAMANKRQTFTTDDVQQAMRG